MRVRRVIKIQDRVRFLSAKRTCQRRRICPLPTRPAPRHHTHSDQAEATALATHPDQLHPQPGAWQPGAWQPGHGSQGHGSQGMAASGMAAKAKRAWSCAARERLRTAVSKGPNVLLFGTVIFVKRPLRGGWFVDSFCWMAVQICGCVCNGPQANKSEVQPSLMMMSENVKL